MRQYKFRAWDGKQMNYDYRDVSLWNGILIAEGDTILMQFTGLTDQLDKEIYEGDIVKWEYEDAVGWHKIKRLVTWVAEDAYFDIPVKRRWTRNIKVIGNIYEHPELVEVRN